MRDETDRKRSINTGGWTLVFEHCESDKFKEAFSFNDYIIIQIDTDTCDDIGYGIGKNEVGTGREFSPEELIEKVSQKLKELIGIDFYNNFSTRIIFAVAVHSTECWLLPLYYDDFNKSRSKGCLDRLNLALAKKEGFTISAKNPDYYELISKKYLKKKTLMSKCVDNPSLKVFIEELEKRNVGN